MKAEIETKAVTARYAAVIPLFFIAGLVGYKWNAATLAIQKAWSSGVLTTRADVVSFGGATGLAAAQHSMNYFAVIWPALAFGVLISAAVRAFVRPEWLVQPLIGAGAAGIPLMLFSCCAAPVFTAVYERSRRLGPSLAIMLASPGLNPAAIALTFLLFTPGVAAARLVKESGPSR